MGIRPGSILCRKVTVDMLLELGSGADTVLAGYDIERRLLSGCPACSDAFCDGRGYILQYPQSHGRSDDFSRDDLGNDLLPS